MDPRITEKNRNVVGSNIRKLRNMAGITQEELALRAGLSQAYINQLENGKRNFTQKSLELISGAMSISMDRMFVARDSVRAGENPFGIELLKKSVRKKPSKRAFLKLLGELPEDVVLHYFALMTIEKHLR